jgi:hypothetical protein
MLQQVNWLIYIAMKLEHAMRSNVLRTECLPAVCVHDMSRDHLMIDGVLLLYLTANDAQLHDLNTYY